MTRTQHRQLIKLDYQHKTTTDDLANIKRQALQDLTPLINHLDQMQKRV